VFSWYSELASTERRTFWACFGGWALDAFDVQIYSFVMPTLMLLWNIDKSHAGLLATSALLVSAFGGWIAGMLADRIGRVRLLQITIGWFALFTFLSGFTNSFEQLLVVRGLQGFGFGGEWAAGSVLIGETIRAKHRGKAVGTVQSAWAWGWGAAALLATAAFQFLPQEYAWRVMFFLGLLPAVAVFFLRRLVTEPKVFVESSTVNSAAGSRRGPFDIFGPKLLPTTVLGTSLAIGAQGGYYAITTWLPTFLRTERHLTVLGSGGYLAVIIIGSFLGYLASAFLCDVLGRRRNFLLFAAGSIAIAIGYTQFEVSDGLMLVLGFPLGFFSAGIFSGMGPLYTELFPTSVRATGQGFCYNCGRGFAALFPTLIGWLSASLSLGRAIGLFAAAAYAIVILTALMLPETRGRELRAN
jgi:MFS family permease